MPAEDFIKLASNENPLGPSRLAIAAMRQAMRHINLYPDGNAFYLKQKLAEKLQVSPANLILGNGSNEVLELLGHALLAPGAEAVVSQYCFAVYPIVTALFGAKLVTVPAKNYGHDLDAMLAAITPNTKVVFVANPNNPTGTTVAEEVLRRFIAAVPENVLVALDEAYVEFLEKPLDLIPEIRGGRQNLLLMRTFSKIYGLAGLRLGYGIGPETLIAELEKIRQPFNANLLAQAGALAALDDTSHVREIPATEPARIEILRARLSQAEAGIRPLRRQLHPRSRRRRTARLRGNAEARRNRAARGRLSIARMGPYYCRHPETEPALHPSFD